MLFSSKKFNYLSTFSISYQQQTFAQTFADFPHIFGLDTILNYYFRFATHFRYNKWWNGEKDESNLVSLIYRWITDESRNLKITNIVGKEWSLVF